MWCNVCTLATTENLTEEEEEGGFERESLRPKKWDWDDDDDLGRIERLLLREKGDDFGEWVGSEEAKMWFCRESDAIEKKNASWNL